MDDFARGLCDQSDDSGNSDEDTNELSGDASEIAARELAQNSGQRLPSSQSVSHCVEKLISDGCIAPLPAVEEEALLLLVRQANSKRSERNGGPDLEGVGDVVGNVAQPQLDDESSDDDSSVGDDGEHSDFDTSVIDMGELDLDYPVGNASGHAGHADPTGTQALQFMALRGWYASFLRTARAVKQVSNMQTNHELGQNRSISLVLMKNSKIPGCKCVRCKQRLRS